MSIFLERIPMVIFKTYLFYFASIFKDHQIIIKNKLINFINFD